MLFIVKQTNNIDLMMEDETIRLHPFQHIIFRYPQFIIILTEMFLISLWWFLAFFLMHASSKGIYVMRKFFFRCKFKRNTIFLCDALNKNIH